MRLVKVSAPQGKGADVAQVAFSVGINEVSISQSVSHESDGKQTFKDGVEINTSTPTAKKFIDALLEAPFYSEKDYSIVIRQPRSIISKESLNELTKPLVEPATDIFEELWQYSHITVGLAARVFLAGGLVAYGLIHQKTLIMIAGLLFLPLLPLLLAVGFGSWTRQWRLAGQGAAAFLLAVALLIGAGFAVASFNSPPVKYDDFASLLPTFLITLAVGIAAGFANIDDVGTRQVIGLAAAAQLGILPVWFGVCFRFGFPATSGQEITSRALSFLVATATITISALMIYVLMGAASRALDRVKTEKQ